MGADITESKRADDALKALNEQLEERIAQRTMSLQQSEERLRVIMDSTVDGVIVINQEGIVENLNRSAADLFGYEASDVVGENVSMLMPEPYQSRHDDYIDRYMDSGVARIIGIEREVRGQRKDGTSFPMELSVSEVGMDGQRLFTGLVRDITERKRVQQDLVAAWKAADTANQAKSEFLSSMSHELRTPLNAILGFAQLLRDYSEQPLTKEQETNIQHILDGGGHLLALVNELLDLSRVEAGRVKLSLESLDPTKVIKESLELVRPLANEREVSLVLPEELSTDKAIIADRNRLKQVLLNLLSNAVKYNYRKGTVTLSATATESDMLCVSIADTGRGISPEKHEEVFHPFSRLGLETSKVEGTGIGLTISRQLIESMGGHLDFESTVGEGSTFWFELPLAPAHQTDSI